MALLTGLNRNTVNRYVRAFRERIAEFCEAQSPLGDEVEADESYFGARRIKGKRSREGVRENDRLWPFSAQWVRLHRTRPGLPQPYAASDYSRQGNAEQCDLFGWVVGI